MQAFFLHDWESRAAGRRWFVRTGFLLALVCAGEVRADPPVITKNLLPQNALTGETVTFSVTAFQSNVVSALSFQWRRNGANIPGTLTNFFTNTVTSTYTITNVQPTDGGAYSVVVFNSDGAVNSSAVTLTLNNVALVPGSDNFDGRVPLFDSISVRASNFQASIEPEEPEHGNVPGGTSIWYVWTIQQGQGGIWVIDTRGSDFDTTLGVYTDPGPGAGIGVLTSSGLPTFESDDANFPNNYHNSSVIINAFPGLSYDIAIDGFYGARGNTMLNISRLASGQVAAIIDQPQSQTAGSNATVVLSFTTDRPITKYQWFRNRLPVSGPVFVPNGVTNGAFTNFNFNIAQVGQYQAFVVVDPANTNGIFTDPASLQLDFQDGGFNPKTVALPKFRETTDPNFVPHLEVHPNSAAVSGFTGTHTWSTFGGGAEPGEPNHCGKVGGSPYWFSYLAPGNGTLTVDTYTPAYTNVLAVYTWPGGTDFSTLVPVGCASTNAGAGHEVAVFPVSNGTNYYLVVDGLNSGFGTVTLTYNMAAPPAITTQPQSQTVPQGSNVTLSVSAMGTPPLSYQWRTNALKFLNRTNFSLTLTNFQATNQGNYDAVVTNTFGAATSSAAMLYLDSPLRFTNYTLTTTNSFTTLLLGRANTNYIFQASTNLAATNWVPILTNSSPYGILSLTDTNLNGYQNRFFRAVVKTN